MTISQRRHTPAYQKSIAKWTVASRELRNFYSKNWGSRLCYCYCPYQRDSVIVNIYAKACPSHKQQPISQLFPRFHSTLCVYKSSRSSTESNMGSGSSSAKKEKGKRACEFLASSLVPLIYWGSCSGSAHRNRWGFGGIRIWPVYSRSQGGDVSW